MAVVTIKIETDNQAFGVEQSDAAAETVRILRDVCRKIERRGDIDNAKLYDINGNVVGEITLSG